MADLTAEPAGEVLCLLARLEDVIDELLVHLLGRTKKAKEEDSGTTDGVRKRGGVTMRVHDGQVECTVHVAKVWNMTTAHTRMGLAMVKEGGGGHQRSGSRLGAIRVRRVHMFT